jgi:hypothetical protein
LCSQIQFGNKFNKKYLKFAIYNLKLFPSGVIGIDYERYIYLSYLPISVLSIAVFKNRLKGYCILQILVKLFNNFSEVQNDFFVL